MNQLRINDQVKNIAEIRKSLKRGKAGNLAENKAFLDFLAIQQEMTAEFDKTWEVIRERMEQYDIKKIDGDWGHILIADRNNWQATGNLPPRFYKQVLDTTKLNFLHKAGGKLPAGVKLTKSHYLTKRIKLA